jgi:hypothetical protein
MIPLGLAVLCFGLSFVFGCLHLRYVETILYSIFTLVRAESGQDARSGTDLQSIAVASEAIRAAINENMARSRGRSQRQFHFLIAGALLFLVWHVLEMYLRTC